MALQKQLWVMCMNKLLRTINIRHAQCTCYTIRITGNTCECETCQYKTGEHTYYHPQYTHYHFREHALSLTSTHPTTCENTSTTREFEYMPHHVHVTRT